jgi:hypothetical protein
MVTGFWPEGIAPLSLEDFNVLLKEMTDLGVLSQPDERHFVLRNAQVAQLLGSRADLEQAVLTAMGREEQVDYDPVTFHSPALISGSDDHAPLTDAQMDALLDDVPNRGKVGVLVAQGDLWSGAGARGLQELIEMRADPESPLSVSMVLGQLSAISTQVTARLDHPKERRVLLIQGEWDGKLAKDLAEHARVRAGVVRPIWLLPGSWLVRAHRTQDLPPHVGVFCARPWTTAMLRHWLESHSLTRHDQPDLREALLTVTGGLPALLRVILPLLQQLNAQAPAQVRQAILAWEPPTGREAPRLDLASFGFTPSEVGRMKEVALELMTSDADSVPTSILAGEVGDALVLSAEAFGLVQRRFDRITLSPLGRLLTK